MGTLLPDRHPNKDFFVLDLKDANPKDGNLEHDMASMEHPVFSLSVKPDLRIRKYRTSQGDELEVAPSGFGLATIMDKDILLYCISKLVHEKNAGKAISPVVRVTAHEVMVACNWLTSGDAYGRFVLAMKRLKGTMLTTTIRTGGKETTHIFGIVDEAAVLRERAGERSAFGRMVEVEVKLSDWMFRSIESMEVLTISRDYFRLRRPLERRLYEIARKHVGAKREPWRISLELLADKIGSSMSMKHLRQALKEIIADGNIPDYGFALDGDRVVMQRLVRADELDRPPAYLPLRPDTFDKAQVLAAAIGVSVFELEREWNDWVRDAGLAAPDSPDAAFIAFCQQKQGSVGARRVVSARETARDALQLGACLPRQVRQ